MKFLRRVPKVLVLLYYDLKVILRNAFYLKSIFLISAKIKSFIMLLPLEMGDAYQKKKYYYRHKLYIFL